MSQVVSLRLKDSQMDRLKKMARRMGRTPTEVGALLLTSTDLAVGDELIIEITPPGSTRRLQVQTVIRNRDHVDGVGIEFQARDGGGVTRLRELIRRLVDE